MTSEKTEPDCFIGSAEVMRRLGIRAKSTFIKRQRLGIIPLPDHAPASGANLWLESTIAAHMRKMLEETVERREPQRLAASPKRSKAATAAGVALTR